MIDSRTFGSGIQGKNYLQLQSTRPRPEFSRLVGFILLDHFSLPSFTQALDTLVTANLLAAGTFATRTYSPTGAEVLSDLGIVIRPDGDYRAAESARFDLLVVCGGLRTPLELDPRLKALLLRAAK
ncbi:AraC family transcriptional regulator, partial [Pseudomonas oryzihabitans]